MQTIISQLVDVPFARMFILAGIIFLLVAVLGKVEGKIDPGQMGRIGASVLGIVLLMVGVLLQFSERDSKIDQLAQEVQARMQTPNVTAQAPALSPDSASAKQGAQPGAVAKPPVLRIVAGTYGRACNGKPGNATPLLTKACDGKAACDYAVEPVDLGPGQESCAKDFVAEWKCGNGNSVYSATLPANAAKGEKLHLACGG